jgi:carbamoyltransferase
VLGLSFSGHGSSVCLVEDGRVVSAINLERLTRVKFALVSLPDYLFAVAGVLHEGFGFGEAPPIANFYDVFPEMLEAVTGERRLDRARIDLVVKTRDNIRPLREKPAPYDEFCEYFSGTTTKFDLEHHLCHAYQAYLSSAFDDTAILTIDGRGEDLERLGGASISTTMAVGDERRVGVLSEMVMPNSVGGMYSSVTRHLGFREEQEGNTMALAAFGTDRFHREVRPNALDLLPDGRFELRQRPSGDGLVYFDEMAKWCEPRPRGAAFTQEHYDLAWSCQAMSEEIMVHLARSLHERTGLRRLALAGGVALNCVANARIMRETPFEEIYVTPNAGDRGLALGAALYGYHVVLQGEERHPVAHDYLGPPLCETSIVAALRAADDIEFRKSPDIESECASLLAAGRIIGWVQGGGEFGPRALGHRSILADPRTAQSKERLDKEIKRREWFRPYAPSVLAERADEYFEMVGPSPYMLLAVRTRDEVRDKVPAIVHADGSARVQTVDRSVEPRYHRLISCFDELTGVPLVLNTSFNGYGDPMVETPADAVDAMHSMGLDALAVGDYLVWRAGSPV